MYKFLKSKRLKNRLRWTWKIPLCDVDDVLMDSVVKALLWWKEESNIPFEMAVTASVPNVVVDYYRRRNKWEEYNDEDHLSPSDVERAVWARELLSQVMAYIDAMDNTIHREVVIRMLIYEEEKVDGVDNPRTIISRFRKNLREVFGEEVCVRLRG